MTELTCFKSYDVRGQLGVNLDASIAYRIGRAFAEVMTPGSCVTGRDIRESSAELQEALNRGLMEGGCDVLDIGLSGTEEVYFATTHLKAGGGLMVTASHNPIDYNGIKMVGEGSRPISGDNGLRDVHDLAASQAFSDPARQGTLTQVDPRVEY
ncbi:UNVERIFIED_CONTAM: hypothetical protein GTU68_049957, partial [Idotea baltica]|nr:hypothetical protein [Idotea baltica]